MTAKPKEHRQARYAFVKSVSPRIVVLLWLDAPTRSTSASATWTQAKIRTTRPCQVLGKPMHRGDLVWAPITTGMNRFHRISDDGILALERGARMAGDAK